MVEKIDEIKRVLEEEGSIAVISAVGKSGTPYTELGRKLLLRPDGKLAYYEYLETSQLHKNLVYSIWFKKETVIHVIAPDRRNYVITGLPYQAVIAGRDFEEAYTEALEEFGENTDLSTIWLIDVLDVKEETYETAKRRQEVEHPYLMHMDHIFKEEIND